MRSVRIAVEPYDERAQRPRLFAALEAAYRLSFVAADGTDPADVDGLLVFVDGTSKRADPPRRVPTLEVHVAGGAREEPARSIRFADDRNWIHPLFAGRTLDENTTRLSAVPLATDESDVVLALSGNEPVWTSSRSASHELTRSCAQLAELADDESLRDRLKAGSFLSLLPVAHFLERRLAELPWTLPPLRACFVFDDPNLHYSSYGYLKFPELISHARRHHYHASLGFIPLDAWFVHQKTAALFQRSDDVVSLAIHGNDHTSREFARPVTQPVRRGLATALERVRRFERRAGIEISRVAIAPFEECSEEMMSALAAAGFDALCFSWGVRHIPKPLLAGWRPADVRKGMPVIPRHPLTSLNDELVFRAYLRQPLVFYGHHQDVASGLDLLAEVSRAVNAVGDVSWCSLGEIARANVAYAQKGDTLEVEPYSRRVTLEIPGGVDRIQLTWPELYDDSPDDEMIVASGGTELARVAASPRGASAPVPAHGSVQIAVRRPDSPAVRPRTTPRIWPFARRGLTEARDRLMPLAARPALRR